MRKVLLLLLGFGGSAVVAILLVQNTVHALVPSGTPLSWPQAVDQTPLRVLALVPYDGAYPEDGSGDPVVNVAALVLENHGSVTLRNGAVKLLQGKQILVFSFTMVPPGARILVAEKSRLPFSDDPVTGCWGWTLEYSGGKHLAVEEYGRSGLTVTNLTEKIISSASICFKPYNPDLDMYIGGYSYWVEVTDLRPGIPRVVPVYRYTSGICKVVK